MKEGLHVIHKITREIVNRAIETDSLIVLGKLKGLRNQEKKGREESLTENFQDFHISMLNNGELVERPRFLDTAVENIKRLQRDLSRKKKGSRRWQKSKIALAKAWRKVRLQREDYCQKVTTNLAKRFETIVFEKLSISKMVKNHKGICS